MIIKKMKKIKNDFKIGLKEVLLQIKTQKSEVKA